MVEAATKYRLTVEQFVRICDTDVFPEGTRVELVDGEIVEMSPIGSRHDAAVARLARITRRLGDPVEARFQSSLRLDHRALRLPDCVLARPSPDSYATAHPGPGDVLLLVEVAESSLPRDRREKGPLYARHGIPEYWIVNLVDDRLEVHRDPAEDGYRDRRELSPDETVSPLAFPDLVLKVADLLP